MCYKDFIDFITNFKKKFLDKKFFILTAYSNEILAGLLIAEDIKKVDSFEKIIPKMYLHLLYTNPKFRRKNIGRKLLNDFISMQKERGTASIYIKLPQKYKSGIRFFQNNHFHQVGIRNNKVILEFYLWNDYGVREYQIVDENFDDVINLE